MAYWQPGQIITADRLASDFEPWVPDTLNLTLGTGQLEGWQGRVGNWAMWGVKLSFGSTTAMSATLLISPPLAPAMLPGVQLFTDVVGSWQYRVGGTVNYTGAASLYDAAGRWITFGGCWNGSAPSARVGVSSSAPATPAAGHILTASGVYPIAE